MADFLEGFRPQKSAAQAFTRVGSRLCWQIRRERWSYKRDGPLFEPLGLEDLIGLGKGENAFDGAGKFVSNSALS